MARPQDKGVSKMPEEKMTKEANDYLQRKRRDRIDRLKRQFKIFYRSRYGKAGFYIIAIFVVITMLEPVLVTHPSYSYLAPAADTSYAKEITSATISPAGGSTLYKPMASSLTVGGTRGVYLGSSNGTIYFMGLGASSQTPSGKIFTLANFHPSSGNKMLQPSMASLESYQKFITVSIASLNDFIYTGFQNGTIYVGQVTSGALAHTTPSYQAVSQVTVNGTLVYGPVSTAPGLYYVIPQNVPFYGTTSPFSQTSGTFMAVSQNTSGYYLTSYFADPLTQHWTLKLPGSSTPSAPTYLGAFYSQSSYRDHAMAFISQGNTLYGISAVNGTIMWKHSFASSVSMQSGMRIPRDYQDIYAPYDSVFMSTTSGNVYQVYSSNGTAVLLHSAGKQLTSLSVSKGSSGFPTKILAITPNSAAFLSEPSPGNVTVQNLTLSRTGGGYYTKAVYDGTSTSFIIASSGGLLLSISATTGGSTPFLWSASVTHSPKNTTGLLYLIDSNTGIGAVSTTTNQGQIVLYNAIAVNGNPIPPTFHTPTGATFPLGTTEGGHDVWSQFIQSFGIDWEFGISIGLSVIVLAVLVAMYVGYKGGFIGSALETGSLALYLIPGLALLIAIASLLGPSLINLIFAVGFIGWPFTAFTLIGVVRGVKARTYVEAARLMGSKSGSILRRHVLPNIGPLLLYLLALSISAGVGAVSGLEVLGIAPLLTPTWGGMLHSVLNDYFYSVTAPWWVFPPTIALSMFIFSFIFVSRGMDEVVNPRLRRR